MGLYGAADFKDADSAWLDLYYGGRNIQSASNIVFSNGLLDPWSSAGVLTNLSDSLVSYNLDLGGHHLDLFFPTPEDPPCAIQARDIEAANILKWIKQKHERNQ